jgi:periplasmic protein TonB
MTTMEHHRPVAILRDDLHKPNWLLRGLILFSVGVHLLMLMHFTGIYQPKVFSRIELTLKQASIRPQREIPLPRPQKTPVADQLEQALALSPAPLDIPAQPFQYNIPNPIQPDVWNDKIKTPRIPVVEDTDIARWQDVSEAVSVSVPHDNGQRVMTERTYTEMVQKQIEAVKQYPKRAQRRNEQGVVTIVFTIGKDGKIVSANIIKSSGSRILDGAALDAVKKASPFTPPPHGSVSVQLPIKFELL